MTPPFFYLDRADPLATNVTVSGDEGRHAVTVRRIAVGEKVQLGDGVGNIIDGEVSAVAGGDELTVRVLARRTVPIPEPSIVVVQAIIKGERMERAVETLTEAGADQVIPWAAQHCVAKWNAAQAPKAVAKLRRRALAASKQARRAHRCEVADVVTTAQVVTLVDGFSNIVVLHEAGDVPLNEVDLDGAAQVALIVGPEGGLSQTEVGLFTAVGATSARMGPSVMRASTAGTVALGWVLPTVGRWSMSDSYL